MSSSLVSDTSPIGSLVLIDRLELLPAIFGQVLIPEKVFKELLVLETDFGRDLSTLKNAPWLVVCQVLDRKAVARFRLELDSGESEAIVLLRRFMPTFF